MLTTAICSFALSPNLFGQSVSLSWDASISTNVTGYRIYYGNTSGNYSSTTFIGNQTNSTISGLQAGANYFFAVTALDADGLESLPSNEVNYQVPDTTNPAPAIALTSPVNGTGYLAPATIDFAASVTANGHTITSVRFFNGTTLVGEDTTAPYSLTWSNVSAGNYSLMARAVYDTGSTIDSTRVSVEVTASASLPAPWQTVDIGSVDILGSASESNGTYTVVGAGNVSGTADNFRFVYQTLTGDGEITARITSAQNTGSNGVVGVMIRESLTSGSKYDFFGISTDGNSCWQRRGSSSGTTSVNAGSTVALPDYWVRLVRSNNKIAKLSSTDGINWNRENQNNLPMASNIQIGLAVASGSSNVLNSATFSNVTVTP